MDNKEISVIITYHNEEPEIYEPLLYSINGQIKIDFDSIEFIISSNCDNPISIDLNKYDNLKDRVKIIYPPIKNSLSASRQYAMDTCNGKYVMFCDCDDIIASPVSFVFALKSIKEIGEADIFSFNCVHEFHTIFNQQWVVEFGSLMEVWGKLYNVNTIRQNDITFDNRLIFNEDRDFNLQFVNKLFNLNIQTVSYPLYINTCRKTSTTASTNQVIKVHDFILFVYKGLMNNSNAYKNEEIRIGLICSAFETIYSLNTIFDEFSLYLTWMFELCLLYDKELSFLLEEFKRGKIDSDSVSAFKNMYDTYCKCRDNNFTFEDKFFCCGDII